MKFFSKIAQLVRVRPSGDSKNRQWPFDRGPYQVVDSSAAVVVVTLDNQKLADDLAVLSPPGLCMTCPIAGGDIEKIVRALITNLSVQHLVCVGEESKKPAAVAALRALFDAPPDELNEALKAAGAAKKQLSASDLAALRKQVEFTDLSGCLEIDKIVSTVAELSNLTKRRTTGFVAPGGDADEPEKRVIAAGNVTHDLVPDKAGEFRISVGADGLVVEHYNNKEELLRTIEGSNARDVCLTLIRNGWVSKLDHAAYLGRELMRAETAFKSGELFVQDVHAKTADSKSSNGKASDDIDN